MIICTRQYKQMTLLKWSDRKWTVKELGNRLYKTRAEAEKSVDEYLAQKEADKNRT